ncbi:MAG: restriction endonuclease [Cyanobacteria bacterium P01_F01_bin.143]
MSKSNIGVDPEEYELIVKDLVEAQFTSVIDGECTSYHRRQYLGKSGHHHEIDVSIEFRVNGMKFIVLIECKSYRNKVGISEVLEFSSRIDDIGAHKGVMVTTCGFQKGAIVFAKSKGITCAVVIGGVWTRESPDISAFSVESSRIYKLRERLRKIEAEDYFAFAAEDHSWNALEATHRRLIIASYHDIKKAYGLHIGFYNLPSGRIQEEQIQSDNSLDSWWEILRSGKTFIGDDYSQLVYCVRDEDGELDVKVRAYNLVGLIVSELIATQGVSVSIQTFIKKYEDNVYGSTKDLLALAEDLMVGSSSKDGYLWNQYAWFLCHTKYASAAVEAGRRATQLQPQQFAYWDTLGWALFHDSQYAKATECLEKATELDLKLKSPKKNIYGKTARLEVRYHLVCSYLQNGDNDKALKTIKEMEKLDKNHNWTERARIKLTISS